MKNSQEFFNNTENSLPHLNVKKFMQLEIETGNAIDLGCGAGRDTIYLIKNGWTVLAIDKECVEERIVKSLTQEELRRFTFKMQDLENVKLEKNNLVVANNSIPFCDKNKFEELWQKVRDSILSGGYFVGTFFGINDEWKNTKENMLFMDKQQVKDLFIEFDIIRFVETEEEGKTALGKKKHWHIFDIIAKKK